MTRFNSVSISKIVIKQLESLLSIPLASGRLPLPLPNQILNHHGFGDASFNNLECHLI